VGRPARFDVSSNRGHGPRGDQVRYLAEDRPFWKLGEVQIQENPKALPVPGLTAGNDVHHMVSAASLIGRADSAEPIGCWRAYYDMCGIVETGSFAISEKSWHVDLPNRHDLLSLDLDLRSSALGTT
jgi:hypothetical protein